MEGFLLGKCSECITRLLKSSLGIFLANPSSYICLDMLGMSRMMILDGIITSRTHPEMSFPHKVWMNFEAATDHALSRHRGDTLASMQSSTLGGRLERSRGHFVKISLEAQSNSPSSIRNNLYSCSDFESILALCQVLSSYTKQTSPGLPSNVCSHFLGTSVSFLHCWYAFLLSCP